MLYNLLISIYTGLIKFFALLGNPKAKKWIEGRKSQNFSNIRLDKRPVIVHSASLGEYEQGKMLIKLIKENTDYPVILTFFSPSGYEKLKNKSIADYVFYLPPDSKKEMKFFIRRLNPAVFIFIKYEFWKNLIDTLHESRIPSFVVFARFYKNDVYFSYLFRNFYKRIFEKLTEIQVQNEESYKVYVEETGLRNISVVGDGRVDTVIANLESNKEFPEILEFKQNKFLLIAGSTWEKDEKILYFWKKYTKDKLIIVPHELTSGHLEKIKLMFPTSMFWSNLDKNKLKETEILVIDTIGMLKHLYKYGDVCYIGGGFGAGIHNTLEAAVFSKPLSFGPNYKRFPEANYFVKNKIAKVIYNASDLITWTENLKNNPDLLREIGKKAYEYIERNKGASQRAFYKIFNK